jgi:hypothetical protein
MTKQYDLFGGEPPAQAHSPTSLAAAAAIKKHIGPMHRKVLAHLRLHASGATDEEMQRDIPMAANTQRPRRRELELMGYVIDSGRVRWTDAGRDAVIWCLKVELAAGGN